MLYRLKRRFQFHHFRRAQFPYRDLVRTQYPGMPPPLLHSRLIAAYFHYAGPITLVFNRRFRSYFIHNFNGIVTKIKVLYKTGLMAGGTAVPQEPIAPEQQLGECGQPDQQRRFLPPQVLEKRQPYARGVPWRGQAGREHAAIGEAGLKGRTLPALHHRNFGARAGKIPGGVHADDAAADDQYMHDPAPAGLRRRSSGQTACTHAAPVLPSGPCTCPYRPGCAER